MAPPFCPVGEVTEHKIPVFAPAGEILVRIYRPTEDRVAAAGLQTADKRLPLYVDYHGGGFVMGSLVDDDPLCRQACQATGCLVANVDYRLSPAFLHPVPSVDSWEALRWLVAHAAELGVDTSRIAIGGLSAGGCIAAFIAQKVREDPAMPPLVHQALIVPVLDARYMPIEGHPSPDPAQTPYESYLTCEYAPMLPLGRLIWFYNLWLGTGPERAGRANDVIASPITATDLKGLAPASFHVAQVDPLNSEARAYHAKLLEAGVPSEFFEYKGACHPFSQWDGALDEAKQFHSNLAAILTKAFALSKSA